MNWFVFRNWLASKIIGYDIEAEVEAAYEAGRQWGKIERAKGLPND
jgi:hypothetical protein